MKKDSTMVREIKEYVGKEVKGLKEYVCEYVGKEVKEIREYVGKEVKGLKEYVDQKLDSGIEEAKRHTGVLIEELRSEVKLVAEQHGDIIRKLEEHDGNFERIDIRFDRVDLELKAMKTALFDNSHRLHDHETRIRRLED